MYWGAWTMMRVFIIADERVGASVFGESGCHWILCGSNYDVREKCAY